jgi:imidazolonepropionase-like amidohydrolase
MGRLVLKNFDLLDPRVVEPKTGLQVLIEDDRIVEVARGNLESGGAETLDLGGRTLMPGLIDCHIHICAKGSLAYPRVMPSLVSAIAGKLLEDTLLRGFTTVRDAGGADHGHKLAVERGLFRGPRLFVAGNPISQTGGHGDFREWGDLAEPCACAALNGLCLIADGVPEVRRTVREQLRRQVDQVKIMVSGGVSSPTDPIENVQFSIDEIAAVVDEAERAQRYVMAHAYTAGAIKRAVEAGVRTIEHGNLIDEPTARVMAETGAYLVPTLVTYRKSIELGAEVGAPDYHIEKAAQIMESGNRSLEIAQAAGVKMAFGTDLFLMPDEHQNQEFLIRAETLTPIEVIRSATLVGAEVVRRPGELGVIAPGAYADLLVVDGNPLEDIGLLADPDCHLAAIMKGGVLCKNRLDRA